MSLLGKACLAMWWDIAPDVRAEFEHWHSHEHFPERLGLPGFHRASRWTSASGGEGIFVMYELASYETLSSPDYLASLNAPSIVTALPDFLSGSSPFSSFTGTWPLTMKPMIRPGASWKPTWSRTRDLPRLTTRRCTSTQAFLFIT